MLLSPIRAARRTIGVCTIVGLITSVSIVQAQKADPALTPNYELAAQWTSQKVSKLVFDSSENVDIVELNREREQTGDKKR
jgi:hypothetical protein